MSTYENNHMQLVEDFINTYDLYLEEPDHLRHPSDLQHFLDVHGITNLAPINTALLEEVRHLRSHLRDCWSAKTLEEMAGELNSLFEHIQVELRLEEDEGRLAIRYALPDATSLLERLKTASALSLMLTIQQYGMERMRSCAAEPCRDVFIDTSRNKSRRFCSERCANRYNVAAFRDRQKNEEAE